MIAAEALEGGFADPPREAQRTFRAILAAMAEPGTARRIDAAARPPAPLPAGIGAVLLTLADQETPVFLAPAFATAAGWVRFHTGAPATADRAAARFAVLEAPETNGFAVGTDAYPDRSATLIVPVGLAGTLFQLSGPGIPGNRDVALSLPPAFAGVWASNRALYPRGLDLLLVDGDHVVGLPRTTEVLCTSR
jgi:alpha-D-ribose 1-methylphosphonate 5-triphosphate synthase subunit PhnH